MVGDSRRFESIDHLVVAAQFDTLQAVLRAVELPMDELLTTLHRIEWDGDTRIFQIRNGALVLTREGATRVQVWGRAMRDLGIVA